ncbi:hypothetical protein QUF58_07680 [Anaerolineales bacterium HSG24]|nr:hypothetical protein [Anaerolineales bacterium HSG24]
MTEHRAVAMKTPESHRRITNILESKPNQTGKTSDYHRFFSRFSVSTPIPAKKIARRRFAAANQKNSSSEGQDSRTKMGTKSSENQDPS